MSFLNGVSICCFGTRPSEFGEELAELFGDCFFVKGSDGRADDGDDGLVEESVEMRLGRGRGQRGRDAIAFDVGHNK